MLSSHVIYQFTFSYDQKKYVSVTDFKIKNDQEYDNKSWDNYVMFNYDENFADRFFNDKHLNSKNVAILLIIK